MKLKAKKIIEEFLQKELPHTLIGKVDFQVLEQEAEKGNEP